MGKEAKLFDPWTLSSRTCSSSSWTSKYTPPRLGKLELGSLVGHSSDLFPLGFAGSVKATSSPNLDSQSFLHFIFSANFRELIIMSVGCFSAFCQTWITINIKTLASQRVNPIVCREKALWKDFFPFFEASQGISFHLPPEHQRGSANVDSTQLSFLVHYFFEKNLDFKEDNWASLVVKNLPANAGDMGLIPDRGRSHMSWSLCTATIEPVL